MAVAIQTRTPAIVWGPPGDGKTSIAEAIGRKLSRQTIIVIGSLHEAQDFGWPFLEEVPAKRQRRTGSSKTLATQRKNMVLGKIPPKWARQVLKGNRIVFLDELSTVPPDVQAAMLRLLYGGVLGDTRLPKSTSYIAAANPPDQAANGFDLAAPMKNRLVHLESSVDTEEWIKGYLTLFPDPEIPMLPDNWQDHLSAARADIAAFLWNKRDALREKPPKDRSINAYATGRSWEHLATPLYAATKALGWSASHDVTQALLSGSVGGHADGLADFLSKRDLPDPETLLANPSSWKPLQRGDHTFSALISVASAVLSKLTPDRWERGFQVMRQAAEQGDKASAVIGVEMIARSKPAGAKINQGDMQVFKAIMTAAA
jgi:hypothetical protein